MGDSSVARREGVVSRGEAGKARPAPHYDAADSGERFDRTASARASFFDRLTVQVCVRDHRTMIAR
jgi:hypothetical protein